MSAIRAAWFVSCSNCVTASLINLKVSTIDFTDGNSFRLRLDGEHFVQYLFHS